MKRAKGTFWTRAGILLLAIVFGVLVYWSVGFVLDDIRVFQRPDRDDFFAKHMDHSLEERLEALNMQMRELEHKHTLINQQRGFIKDSSAALQIIVDNLFKLKNRDQQLITEKQFDQVLASLDKIIKIQDDYKTTAQNYIEITNDKYELQKEIAALKRRIEEKQAAVRALYHEALNRQRIKTTILRMAVLVPLAILCTVILIKKRKSFYRLIWGSTALAVYIKTAVVIHERFPSRYFKYILTICLLGLVGWGFVWVVRRLVRPNLNTLIKQYRQSYERFLCPVCEYPIRRGPRKHLYWTRRTVNKTALSSSMSPTDDEDKPYTCPACSTRLFEKCESCGATRHSLLPTCRECGARKEIAGDQY